MIIRLAGAAILILGAAVMGGCGEKQTEPTILTSRAQYFVFDVPVPEKFELARDKSTHDIRAGTRVIKHFYVGADRPMLANNFYRQKMPEFQWELDEDQLRNGVDFLNYKKGDEKCEIRIEQTPGGLFGSKTQVCVEIQSTQ